LEQELIEIKDKKGPNKSDSSDLENLMSKLQQKNKKLEKENEIMIQQL
jgi:hypothetical protein